MSTVYLNGGYGPSAEARVSVDDRGFLFADGVYELTPAYQGRPFRIERHLERLRRGLGEPPDRVRHGGGSPGGA